MGKKKEKPLEVYTQEQLEAVEEHIEKYFGEIKQVFSAKEPEYLKLNINVIPPDRHNHFYTLVTSGMGAHIMNTPDELKGKHLERAELVICLPPDWDFESKKAEYYWPLKLLSLVSIIPIEENAWLGWGHTIDYGSNFADNVGFCSVMLTTPKFDKKCLECNLPDGEKVLFYQLMPLYRKELEFKHDNGASALVSRFAEKAVSIADTERVCVVPDNFRELIDTVAHHSDKITNKNLDVLEINGANHISAFIQWCFEHDMMNDDFLDFFEDDIKLIKSGEYDIRKFLINSLGGEFTTDILTDTGSDFAHFYYSFYCEPPSYPNDVDKMAEAYFGEEKYNCKEFQDEAYLFVPFGRDYISAMYKYIDHAYSDFCYFKEHKRLPDEEPETDETVVDSYDDHVWKIQDKGLATDEINAVNHITAFIRWCIEHNLMHDDFVKFYADYQDKIQSGELDMRDFVINNLGGDISMDMFNSEGQAFCEYYYDFTRESDEPCYPEDVDRMALDYFGEEKYNCGEFQDEAYLFVPFNKTYYRNISRYINRNYRNFKKIHKK